MYGVGSKLLNVIKSMYVDIIAYERVKWCESECFRTDNGVRQGCIMSPWLFHMCIEVVMNEVKMEMKRMRMIFLYKDDLILYGDSEDDLKEKVGRFVEVYRRRGLKFNADKSKVMVLGG